MRAELKILRTYTDGLWTCGKKPRSPFVLAMRGTAVDPGELYAAVSAALLARPASPLTFGQQVVFEAIRGFDDDVLVAAAPYIHELLRHGLPAFRH